MAGHHFISYSAADASEAARRIADALEGGEPAIPVWLDKLEKERQRLRPGELWPEEIAEALRTCASLVFVMTPDSVAANSVCTVEWMRARRYKKPIIPVRVLREAEIPLLLEGREEISLEGSFDAGTDRLRRHLLWLASPAGVLRSLENRRADADRDLRRAEDAEQRRRIEEEIQLLESQIRDQRDLVEHPQEVALRVQHRVAQGLAAERRPEHPPRVEARCPVINLPPGAVPTYFQDRGPETDLLVQHLEDEAPRLVFVVGRGGVGKTTFVCRLLKAIENGQWPDGQAVPAAQGIVYLSAAGSRRISFANLFGDLCKLLPPVRAAEVVAAAANPLATTTSRMEALLCAFPSGRVLVLLDNFEDLVEPRELSMRDGELADVVRAVLNAPPHAVKLIVTTRVAPRDLSLEQPGRQARLDLDEGLPSPFAENLLRAKDADGKLGLKAASDELLAEARARTRGYPRALEALAAILSADRDTSLAEVLDDTRELLPENVMRALVGEAFSRLEPGAQQVMQALAVYGRPVTAEAVDDLLQPYSPGEAGAAVLRRLVNMQFARKEGGRYYLHPVDREYALRRVPRGVPADRGTHPAPYTQLALLHRAADHFTRARQDRASWRTLDDLSALLAEFDLRCAAEDHAAAYGVLSEFETLLSVWSHYRLLRDLNLRLEGKLDDPNMRLGNLLGIAEGELKVGRYSQAIGYLEAALAASRALGDKENERFALYSIGWCRGELGETAQALEFTQQALQIALDTGDVTSQANMLSLVGWNLGKQGLVDRSIECCQRAVDMLRGGGTTNYLATALANLAGVLLDAGRHDDAIDNAQESLRADPESINLRSWNSGFLARAHLARNDLGAARAAAEVGRGADEPENNANVSTLLGIVCVRQGQRDAAADAFRAALGQADALIQFAPNQNALDAKGLALAGLALCEGSASEAAAESHRAARALNHDEGVIRRVRWHYDALAPADPGGLLAVARRWDTPG